MTTVQCLCLCSLLLLLSFACNTDNGTVPVCSPGGSMDSGVLNDAGDDRDGGNIAFTKHDFLLAVGQCAIGRYVEFESLMDVLDRATETLASAPTTANRDAAQTAFRGAMAAWQRAELFQFGPAARATEPGGRGIRDQIYFFPATNRCLIDQQIVSRRYADASFPDTLASSRGLAAIEYLLFHEGADNACGSALGINTSGSWSALTATELAQRRADYAHATTTDILVHARTLASAWAPSSGNFIEDLSTPCGGNVYATEQDALNAVIASIFYVDEGLKDFKLAIPLSIPLNGVIDCADAPGTCPERLESPFARMSTDNIRQNLIAFRQIFQGCDQRYRGLGVDDWLRSIDQRDLADGVLSALDHADATVNALGALEDATIETPPARALALHAAIKAVSDLLKTEVVMVLNVQLPIHVGGDVD